MFNLFGTQKKEELSPNIAVAKDQGLINCLTNYASLCANHILASDNMVSSPAELRLIIGDFQSLAYYMRKNNLEEYRYSGVIFTTDCNGIIDFTICRE
jgi:ribosomal protein S15P/S13E